MTEPQRRSLMDTHATERALSRMAREVVRLAGGAETLILVGIHRRGVQLAERMAAEIRATGATVATGTLDITLYRDDLMTVGPRPVVGPTKLPTLGIDGRIVAIVDDVLYTGRTVRAAIDAIMDRGRPASIQLAVLVDRGHRELPIRADYVGKNVPTSRAERVQVHLTETDGLDEVVLLRESL